jgi:hypothetical protein
MPTINYCSFSANTKGSRCERCGHALRSDYSQSPSRMCDIREAPRAGLGDYVATGLANVGITKKFVEGIVGGPCGCEERQEALNELGKGMGL